MVIIILMPSNRLITKMLSVLLASKIQNNSANSGGQASNQQPVMNNDNTDQQINEALNSFLGYIKQLDQKLTHRKHNTISAFKCNKNFGAHSK